MENSSPEFGLKELYKVVIKTTSEIEINGKTLLPNETIAAFDKIFMSYFDDTVTVNTAHGGWDNRDHVWWESTKDAKITLSQGIFSKEQWSVMTNAKLFPIEKDKPFLLNKRERLESDESSVLTLSQEPYDYLFIYNQQTGEKIEKYTSETVKSVKVDAPYQEYLVDYGYLYDNGGSTMTIGRQLSTGFFALEGRTRVKDDITGQVHTGIISIPKLKLMSNISIRLGTAASPVVGQMDAVAIPVGGRGKSKVMDLTFLNDDIDSDI